jgi:hypothetical protein
VQQALRAAIGDVAVNRSFLMYNEQTKDVWVCIAPADPSQNCREAWVWNVESRVWSKANLSDSTFTTAGVPYAAYGPWSNANLRPIMLGGHVSPTDVRWVQLQTGSWLSGSAAQLVLSAFDQDLGDAGRTKVVNRLWLDATYYTTGSTQVRVGSRNRDTDLITWSAWTTPDSQQSVPVLVTGKLISVEVRSTHTTADIRGFSLEVAGASQY